MDNHHHDTAPVAGPWAGGWLIAALAGLFAAFLAVTLAGLALGPAAAAGAGVFLVFGVLLGTGGVELTLSGDHGGHDHGHDGDGHH